MVWVDLEVLAELVMLARRRRDYPVALRGPKLFKDHMQRAWDKAIALLDATIASPPAQPASSEPAAPDTEAQRRDAARYRALRKNPEAMAELEYTDEVTMDAAVDRLLP